MPTSIELALPLKPLLVLLRPIIIIIAIKHIYLNKKMLLQCKTLQKITKQRVILHKCVCYEYDTNWLALGALLWRLVMYTAMTIW